MSKHSKGIIWLADTSRHASLVTYHRGLSGADHKFVWVEKHQAHIYEGRELEEEEFNKVALEIFGSRDATYHKPVARLVELAGEAGGKAAQDIAKVAELQAELVKLGTENAGLKTQLEAEIAALAEKPSGETPVSADATAALEAKDAEIARLQGEINSLTSIISGKAESTPATAKKRKPAKQPE